MIPVSSMDSSHTFINGLLQTIALLPNIEDLFTKCANENLSDSAFQSKFADAVLVKYRLDDLEEIDNSEEEWLEDEDFEDIVSNDIESAMDIN